MLDNELSVRANTISFISDNNGPLGGAKKKEKQSKARRIIATCLQIPPAEDDCSTHDT